MRKISDQLSSKEAQTKVSKKVHSANVREKRIMTFRNATLKHPANKKYCEECGFRVRGERHLEGAHHNGSVAVCKRN